MVSDAAVSAVVDDATVRKIRLTIRYDPVKLEIEPPKMEVRKSIKQEPALDDWSTPDYFEPDVQPGSK